MTGALLAWTDWAHSANLTTDERILCQGPSKMADKHNRMHVDDIAFRNIDLDSTRAGKQKKSADSWFIAKSSARQF